MVMADYLNNKYSRCQMTACSSRHGHQWCIPLHSIFSYKYDLFLFIFCFSFIFQTYIYIYS